MDVLYRGFETTLLACALALGAAALLASSMPHRGGPAAIEAVTLPMLSVVAERGALPVR